MKLLIVFFAVISVAAGQSIIWNNNNANRFPSCFACSTAAGFVANIDGQSTNARCTDAASNPAERCPGCCASVALAAGLSADRASGFPSTNGRSCVCCVRSC
ncbi:uncharacterized protein CELE_Y37D8A.19 [Caenorhabditis elegans]|uniref:Secreted protein n=1 Tax=Caenorhabditis elegans TaxID=6239 RepID=Q9XWU9_CAEEL|nr:Secreted protein [Caenorhabditis elegans]CAA21542.1 Secreted protein [Caenorhabditis elegans]|eukprot:NP_499687.1 Uncharacterized protein CELE_Y37D8A.19 [Caenorhabditis elegans]